jgi:hypothetical protein
VNHQFLAVLVPLLKEHCLCVIVTAFESQFSHMSNGDVIVVPTSQGFLRLKWDKT